MVTPEIMMLCMLNEKTEKQLIQFMLKSFKNRTSILYFSQVGNQRIGLAQGFFNLRRIDILGWITVMRRLSHVLFDVQQHSWPCPLDTSENPLLLVLTTENLYRHCQCSSRGKTACDLRTTVLEELWYLFCSFTFYALNCKSNINQEDGFCIIMGYLPIEPFPTSILYTEFKTVWSSPGSVCNKTATLWYLNVSFICKLISKK